MKMLMKHSRTRVNMIELSIFLYFKVLDTFPDLNTFEDTQGIQATHLMQLARVITQAGR